MNKYIANINYWDEIEVEANNFEEAREKIKNQAKSNSNLDFEILEISEFK